MPSQQHVCAYIKCNKKFYGTKAAKYCSQKCGTYQRRLDEKDDSTKEYLDNLYSSLIKEHDAQTKIMKDADIDFVNSDRWIDGKELKR